MYFQINTVKINLAHKDDFVAIVDSEELKAAMQAAPGFRASYLVQSVVDREEFASVSLWDSPSEGQAFFGSPDYAAILGGVRAFLLSNLDRRGYEVLVDFSG